jgi:hypothetical protein
VKKRLQGQTLQATAINSGGSSVRYLGFFHCFSTIYSVEGLVGFYRVSGSGGLNFIFCLLICYLLMQYRYIIITPCAVQYSSTINHQPSTINHQPSTINHQPSTINHQPSTINRAWCQRPLKLWPPPLSHLLRTRYINTLMPYFPFLLFFCST